jgi:hypothetical protein
LPRARSLGAFILDASWSGALDGKSDQEVSSRQSAIQVVFEARFGLRRLAAALRWSLATRFKAQANSHTPNVPVRTN